MTFTIGSVIKVNGKNFTITGNDGIDLRGTFEGDLACFAGKRSLFINGLVKSKNGFSYK